jgi:SAM-dependent methyltransferase
MIEPDRALAEYLRKALRATDAEIEIHVAPFEEVELPAESYDLGVAATSFHWVEQRAGLRKAWRLLAPGGWWAMWWNVFNDPQRADPFHDATNSLFRGLPHSPTAGERGRPQFALDVEVRTRDLAEAGFEDIEVKVIPWTASLSTAQIRDLYSTFSPVARLAPAERASFLDRLTAIAEQSFDGHVERAFQTVLYTARRA